MIYWRSRPVQDTKDILYIWPRQGQMASAELSCLVLLSADEHLELQLTTYCTSSDLCCCLMHMSLLLWQQHLSCETRNNTKKYTTRAFIRVHAYNNGWAILNGSPSLWSLPQRWSTHTNLPLHDRFSILSCHICIIWYECALRGT